MGEFCFFRSVVCAFACMYVLQVKAQTLPLRAALQEIQRQYEVNILYEDKLVEGLHVTKTKKRQNLETQLKDLLNQFGLIFKQVGEKQYFIQKSEGPIKIIPKPKKPKRTILGYVREEHSQELLIGANVRYKNQGVSTNNYGFYSITIEDYEGDADLVFSLTGYEWKTQKLNLIDGKELNIWLTPALNQLQTVVVNAKHLSDEISQHPQMSQIELPIAQVQKMPALLGEKDIFRILQLMPGVQKGSELQTGLYVRGGSPDQNLVILDEAPVYNASHIFGFLSTFNADAIKSVEFTKGGFPARFGGRLSSVLELNMKEGNKEKLHGEGSIGYISSKLTIEAPIIKNKASFIISARRTYSDLLVKPTMALIFKDEQHAFIPIYYFCDINAKMNVEFNKKNKVYLSSYLGGDKFGITEKDSTWWAKQGIGWGNATATLRWNHLFSEKLFANSSLIYSRFQLGTYSESEEQGKHYYQRFNSNIRDHTFKIDFDYFPNTKHTLRWGAMLTNHLFVPNARQSKDSMIQFNETQTHYNNTEAAFYAEDTWITSSQLKFNLGLRWSFYSAGQKNYAFPEPRLSMMCSVVPRLAFKASYSLMNQYIHLLSSTGIGLPTDLWVPSTTRVPPQRSEQLAMGLAKDFENHPYNISLEVYYKKMNSVLTYKEGASFMNLDQDFSVSGNLPTDWQDNVTSGVAWAKGLEFLVQKKTGKFSGWLGYTWAMTRWQFQNLNFGEPFYPRHDRRHDFSIVGIYQLNKKITLSSTWVYGTGNVFTIPQASYLAITNNSNIEAIDYGERNAFRGEAYHRWDISLQIHQKRKRYDGTWDFSIYNAYNRANPFFYTIEKSKNGQYNALFRNGAIPILPSISYQFKF